MAEELPEILQRIAIEGTDEVKDAFNEIKEAGVKLFEALEHASLGGIFVGVVEILAAVSLAAIGTGVGLGVLSHSASETSVEIEHLALQAGTSVEELSALTSALASQGANIDALSTAFRRFSFRIQTDLPSIIKAWRDAADKQVENELKIKQSYLSIATATTDLVKAQVDAANQSATAAQKQVQSQLAVQSAFLSVERAKQNLENIQTGQQTDPAIEQILKEKEAVLALKQAREQLAEAKLKQETEEKLATNEQIISNNKLLESQLKLEQAQQEASTAQKKAIDDQANSIPVLKQAVEDLSNGITSNAGKANLSIENIFKGLVASVAGADKSFKGFTGDVGELANVNIGVEPALLKLADVFHNLDDSSKKTALATLAFGRGVGEDLVRALSLGSKGLQEFIAAQKKAGLVLNENDAKIGSEFHESLNNLVRDLSIVKTQIGNLFSPAFSKGFEELDAALSKLRPKIIDFAQSIADQAKPIIEDFFHVITTGGDTSHLQTSFIGPVVEGLKVIYNFVKDVVGPTIVDFFRVLSGEPPKQQWVADFVEGLKTLSSGLVEVFKAFKEFFVFISEGFSGFIKTVNDAFGTNFSTPVVAATGIILALAAALGGLPLVILTAVVVAIGKLSEGAKQLASLPTASWADVLDSKINPNSTVAKDLEALQKQLDDTKKKALDTQHETANTAIQPVGTHGGTVNVTEHGTPTKIEAPAVDESKNQGNASRFKDPWIRASAEIADRISNDFKKIGGDGESTLNFLGGRTREYSLSWNDVQAAIKKAGESTTGVLKIAGTEFIDAQKQIEAINKSLAETGKFDQGAIHIRSFKPSEGDTQAWDNLKNKIQEALDKIDSESKKGASGLGVDTDQAKKLGQTLAEIDKTGIQQGSVFNTEGEKQAVDTLRNFVSELDQVKNKTDALDESGKKLSDISVSTIAEQAKTFDTNITDSDTALKGFVTDLDKVKSSATGFDTDFESAEEKLRKFVDDLGQAKTSGDGLGQVGDKIKDIDLTPLSSGLENLSSLFDTIIEKADTFLSKLRDISNAKINPGSSPDTQGAQGLSGGGHIRGPGGKTSDKIPIWASDFEYMMRAVAVEKYGVNFMHSINNLSFELPKFPKFALGGLITSGAFSPIVPQFNSDVFKSTNSKQAGRIVNLNFGLGNKFQVTASDNVADGLERFAVSSSVVSTGRKPAWFGK